MFILINKLTKIVYFLSFKLLSHYFDLTTSITKMKAPFISKMK